MLGLRVAGVGDVNGDGIADIIISEPNYQNSENGEGRVMVFEGIRSASALFSTPPSWSFESNVILGRAGYSVAGGGGFNGDGYSDIKGNLV